MGFEVVRIPVWTDNYAWLLVGDDGDAALVDSPEAGPVEAELAARGLRLTHIFNTHHHFDHVGANAGLAASLPGLEIWAGRYDREHGRIPGQTRALADGEFVHFGGVRGIVREIPGHTLGHIGYFFDNGHAFVGDTIFFGGCGRLFEGTAEQMDRSLHDVIGGLPQDTLLHCAHEYTASNLAFARSVDGDNAALLALSEQVAAARAAGEATVPSRLAQEWAVNPFLRCDTPAIRAATGLPPGSPRHAVLGALRELKNGFAS